MLSAMSMFMEDFEATTVVVAGETVPTGVVISVAKCDSETAVLNDVLYMADDSMGLVMAEVSIAVMVAGTSKVVVMLSTSEAVDMAEASTTVVIAGISVSVDLPRKVVTVPEAADSVVCI